MSRIKTLIIDKTGTLTYGSIRIKEVNIEPNIDSEQFWFNLAVAEKFSEHPIARAILHEAHKNLKNKEVPDPEKFLVYKGSGISAEYNGKEIVVGDESIITDTKIVLNESIKNRIAKIEKETIETTFFVFINKEFAGFITVSDIPREEAGSALKAISELGVEQIIMFTGDNEKIASDISKKLDIKKWVANMLPQDKLSELEKLAKESKNNPIAMIGDGVNDAPALSRSDVGIAMGKGGTAVAVEAADVVILNDDLSKLPEIIRLSRKTRSVIYGDMVIWFLSNAFGFALVLTGFAGPALAAFYNFITDFFPLINSLRLFKK